jgi:hypothetical protein
VLVLVHIVSKSMIPMEILRDLILLWVTDASIAFQDILKRSTRRWGSMG